MPKKSLKLLKETFLYYLSMDRYWSQGVYLTSVHSKRTVAVLSLLTSGLVRYYHIVGLNLLVQPRGLGLCTMLQCSLLIE